ncbi:hypothetical protein FRB91_004398 [Serendipita sp. 411]|nr:hypothetical protein FRC16_001689 [Serendipita sp. 398]KAG8842135.1 hypothetical protein FRB91_004398 [Serendipita sp. 411]
MFLLRDSLDKDEWQIVQWEENRAVPRAWLEENIQGAEGILVLLTDKVDDSLLTIAGPNLRIVSTMSVGYDHIETSALKTRRIKLGFTPDVLTFAVADLTVLLVLMATRNAGEAVSLVKAGKWPELGFSPFLLCGPQIGSGVYGTKPYTVGFIGFGRIAKMALKRLSPYGISRCLYANRRSAKASNPLESTEEDTALAREMNIGLVHAAPLSYIAAESDLVIVLAPGGPETHHIVDEGFLRKMKPTAVLVNTSRGTLVDTDALVKALQENWIWSAGLDVVEGEPNITADHPLLQLPRAVILPHIGSATLDTREAMARLAVENLVNGLKGERIEHQVSL